uniref:DUF608 domain-containing protein n=1 Tax=Heterorhabditis bacteriophora TaxID=37862 RepID=A0A1I7X7X7_HETBA
MSDLTSCQLMKYGRFGYMESWEYYMLNTYDVHFYASWALLENWPQLEMSIQLNFFGEPWSETNAYILHDTGEWRDLNLKFVLLCWRDWKMIALKEMDNDEAENLLRFFYERSKVIINRALSDWDIDGDGMIENSGIADQTYDVWTMSGTSAYCGSLWLAALSVAVSMADKLKVHEESAFFKDILSKAKSAFNNKLWNGKESGIVDTSSIQSEEVWTGIAYSIASFLISKVTYRSQCCSVIRPGFLDYIITIVESGGMIQEGFQTAHGIFESCWNRFGLQYQTPEAIYEKRYYRAIGYMRPLSIWSMQHAIQKKISL